jgi:hypothetical protein
VVVVVGTIPAEIRVSREQYLGLLDRLDQATHSQVPARVELAYDLLAVVGSWIQEGKLTGQVDGQLELPLEWAESRAGR